MPGLNAPTSDLLLRLLLLGLSRTSLKSSLRSASTRGILLGWRGAGARALLAAVAAPLRWLRSAAPHRLPSRAGQSPPAAHRAYL